MRFSTVKLPRDVLCVQLFLSIQLKFQLDDLKPPSWGRLGKNRNMCHCFKGKEWPCVWVTPWGGESGLSCGLRRKPGCELGRSTSPLAARQLEPQSSCGARQSRLSSPHTIIHTPKLRCMAFCHLGQSYLRFQISNPSQLSIANVSVFYLCWLFQLFEPKGFNYYISPSSGMLSKWTSA